MNKEEIFCNTVHPFAEDNNNSVITVLKIQCLKAMDEYAQQQSIAFAEWTELNGYHIKGMDDTQRSVVYKLFLKYQQKENNE